MESSTTLQFTPNVADAATLNPNGIRTLLANSVSTFSLVVNQLPIMVYET